MVKLVWVADFWKCEMQESYSKFSKFLSKFRFRWFLISIKLTKGIYTCHLVMLLKLYSYSEWSCRQSYHSSLTLHKIGKQQVFLKMVTKSRRVISWTTERLRIGWYFVCELISMTCTNMSSRFCILHVCSIYVEYISISVW